MNVLLDKRRAPPSFGSAIRAYEFVLRDEEGMILVPPGLRVPDHMREFHAECADNARRAMDARRDAKDARPLAFVLVDAASSVVGCGVLGEDDNPDSIATLAGVFAEMGLRFALGLPPGSDAEQVGAPLHSIEVR